MSVAIKLSLAQIEQICDYTVKKIDKENIKKYKHN